MKKLSFLSIGFYFLLIVLYSCSNSSQKVNESELDNNSEVSTKDETLSSNEFVDSRDDNVYKTVKIGSQTWMAENLKYLPSVVGAGTGSETTPYYYVYGYEGINVNDAKATTNYQTYGVLYNWSAAKQACPTGWHLPSDAEWTELTDYLGGEDLAGGKLKATGTIEAGTGLWYEPNTDASNETGFTALPGGYRYDYGIFDTFGYGGDWWSSSEYDSVDAWHRGMYYGNSGVSRSSDIKELGFSVRCVRD
ncbi:MAG: hypothetical protein GX793_08700 [Bacteroidales bacterium]|jgi:uncharacterized protein (TIGR02145 family)|nr:fibrobacter succinogenes major paralogous domain-containing protein [Bacteroidales bacterium]MCK9498717.1 fibrobacter succinogenes major paralogous domain-containing protein [Bacteroidales bacterium]MDY0315425.1 FISUMP domain-containing protein [Bacteroidales bacterium]NLB87124.1 hypothetical protein [Bacteroidales bacterium]